MQQHKSRVNVTAVAAADIDMMNLIIIEDTHLTFQANLPLGFPTPKQMKFN